MEKKIVLGSLFGDEGKGTVVQWLCKEAIADNKKCAVVRFCGGPQAGHTVTHNGITHEFSSFGSGTLLGVPTYITENVLVDPICLCKEWDVLLDKGIEPEFRISTLCRIITPYDVIHAREDKKTLQDGTTGHGVYAAVIRNEDFPTYFLDRNPEDMLKNSREYYGLEKDEELEELFISCYNRIKDFYYTKVFPSDVLIYEGTQGLLLDAERGFYPNVTATEVGLNALDEETLEDAEVYFVTRTYLTRHGSGYDPQYFDCFVREESNKTNEFQGKFKVGAMEFSLLGQAFERHCIDNYINKYNIKPNLVVTHLDLPENKAYYYYDKNERLRYFLDPDKDSIMSLFVEYIPIYLKKIFYSDNNLSDIKEW